MGPAVQVASPVAAAAGTAASAAPPVTLGVKNIHALRTLFNVSHRLADSLGHAWVYVVEVLFTLERALPPAAGVPGKVRGGWADWSEWLFQGLTQGSGVARGACS